MRVLVVEDEADMAAAVARGLRRHGLAVDLAGDGREALVKAGLVRNVRTAVQNARALLVVANSGSIVPADEVGHLTNTFRRGGTARIGDGHGLGLAIVAAVAHAHRGQLTIEPISEGGLRVQTRLPLAAGAVLDTPAVPDTSGGTGELVAK
jgi:signal transduction histidine kinase